VLFAGALLAGAAGCKSRSSSGEGPVPELQAWTPEAAQLENLNPPLDVEGYRVRPPQGYIAVARRHGGTRSLIWQGPSRPDGSTPKFWVMVGKLAPGEEKLSLEETCSLILAGASQKMDDYSETLGERGRIGDLTFLRLTFRGKEKARPHRGHGVVYHAHDGQQYIHITLMDSEPHHAEVLPLLEAAARTFQRS
jgi:hypothetical protein